MQTFAEPTKSTMSFLCTRLCVSMNVTGVLLNWPRQLLAVSAADGIEPLLKLAARRDTSEMLEVLSLAFANLSANNPSNCRFDSARRVAPARDTKLLGPEV